MRYATQMEKGDPNLVAFATKTKAEMNEFVSFYRRSTGEIPFFKKLICFSVVFVSLSVQPRVCCGADPRKHMKAS